MEKKCDAIIHLHETQPESSSDVGWRNEGVCDMNTDKTKTNFLLKALLKDSVDQLSRLSFLPLSPPRLNIQHYYFPSSQRLCKLSGELKLYLVPWQKKSAKP